MLNRRFTVYKELINWIKLFIVFYTYLLFLWVLLFSTFLVFFGSMCARSKKCIFICLCIYLPHVLIVLYECRQRFASLLIFESATVLLRGSTIFNKHKKIELSINQSILQRLGRSNMYAFSQNAKRLVFNSTLIDAHSLSEKMHCWNIFEDKSRS